MILSREDAVSGFRALVGPTEPEKAKEEAPNRYGFFKLIQIAQITLFLKGILNAFCTDTQL